MTRLMSGLIVCLSMMRPAQACTEFISRPKSPASSREIVVAVIDTGLDLEHPLIRHNLWSNPNEIKNGKDDDGNGLIDDIHGWNFVSNNSDLSDRHGHGTHVTGLILEAMKCVKGNGESSPVQLKVMSLKYYDSRLGIKDTMKNSVASMRYALSKGVEIINYSGGGDEPHDEEKKVLAQAESQGVLIVAAAGNGGRNSDRRSYFPANYEFKNILSVAASDGLGGLGRFSNYGEKTVDIAAPGVEVRSALPNGKVGLLSGTSQATAYVTGWAAVLMSLRSDLRDPQSIVAHILLTRKAEDELSTRVAARGVLQPERLLYMHNDNYAADANSHISDQLFMSNFGASP